MALVAAGGVAAVPRRGARPGGARRAALRRGDGERRASPTRSTAALTYLDRRRASRCSTATATGARTSTSPAASTRPRCSATRARPAARCGSREVAGSGTDLDAVTGAYPIDIDADGLDRPRRAPGRPVDAAPGPRRLPVRAGERGLGRRRRPPAWTTAFSATWEGDATLPTLAFGNYVALDAAGEVDVRLRRQRAVPARRVGHAATAAPIAAVARLLHAVDPVQRLGRLGPPRPAGDATTATTTATGERAAVAGRARRGAARVHGRRRLGAACRSGAWGSRARTSRATGCRRSTSRARATTSSRRWPAGRRSPPTTTSRSRRGVTASQPSPGGDALPSTAWHPEFEDVNNDGLMDLFVSKGNVGEVPDYAMRDPSNLFLGQPDGTFVEGARGRGHRRRSTRAAAPRSPTSTRTACSTSSRPTSARRCALWRNVGAGTADAPAPMGNWLALRLRQPGGNRDAIGAVIETQGRRRRARAARLTIGGGHIGGQLGWTHLGHRARDGGPGPGDVAGRRGRAVDDRRRQPVPRHRARRDARPTPVDAAEPADGGPTMATARLTTVDLPDFGMPAVRPGGPGVRATPSAWPRCASGPTPRASTASSSTPTASTARTSRSCRASTRGSRRRCWSSGRPETR